MKFRITVHKNGRRIASYHGIGNSFDLHAAAIDMFGVCAITVRRL